VQTNAYHPQSNGMVERMHGQLKAALRAWLAGSSWPEHLPWVLLGLRTAPKEDNGVSAAELVYRAVLVLPAEFLSTAEPLAAELLQKHQQVEIPATRPLSKAEVAAKPPAALLQASHVYVQHGCVLLPLVPLYVGLYEVLERADKFFRPAVCGREETVSIDRLKPHMEKGPFSPARPAARGRPPASAPVVVQPQHPPAAATRGGTVTDFSNI
jgi:hypothetical protein